MVTVPDYDDWFRTYAEAYTRSLGGEVEVELIRGYYAETVLALGVDGRLSAAESSTNILGPLLEHLFEYYASIGTRRMTVDRVEVSPLYENHDRVQVFYDGHYEKPDGPPLTISFDVVYLVQRREPGPVIFAFISDDEQALYRQHGLVDTEGKPLAGA